MSGMSGKSGKSCMSGMSGKSGISGKSCMSGKSGISGKSGKSCICSRKICAAGICAIAICLAMAVALLPAAMLAGCDAGRKPYEEAAALLNGRQYAKAAAAFDALGDYRDAAARAMEARNKESYAEAEALLANGQGIQAAKAFAAIGGYLDAAARSARIYGQLYGAAEDMLEREEYAQAIGLFERLEGYKDSNDRIREAQDGIAYDNASALLGRGEYGEALAAFKAVAGYRDADAHIMQLAERNECYEDAQRLIDGGRYADALAKLKLLEQLAQPEALGKPGQPATAGALQGYKDAPKNMLYCNANIALLGGEYEYAHSAFAELKGFRDSREKLDETDEALFRHTLELGSIEKLDAYMSLPGCKYKDEALAERSRLILAKRMAEAADAFRIAMDAGTISALDGYLAKWGKSEYSVAGNVERAISRIAELKEDESLSAGILGNPGEATTAMINGFLSEFPGHKDEQKIKALTRADIHSLLKSGQISAGVTGGDIQSTNVNLANNVKHDLTVDIPIGTYFDADSPDVQDMAVLQPIAVSISAGCSIDVSVQTACMNIQKDIPQARHSLQTGSLDPEKDSKLVRVISLCYERDVPFVVAQAALWIVTDAADDATLLETLIYAGGKKALSPDGLAAAKQIVNDAG